MEAWMAIRRNPLPVAWLIGYLVLILLLLPMVYAGVFTQGFDGVNRLPLRAFNISDLVLVLWPALVPAVVFWRQANGQQRFTKLQILVWGAVPTLVFVGFSMMRALGAPSEGVARLVMLFMHTCLGWTLMIAWTWTMSFWGKPVR